jgi:hypothetical protein
VPNIPAYHNAELINYDCKMFYRTGPEHKKKKIIKIIK